MHPARRAREMVLDTGAFLVAVLCYWLLVFPRTRLAVRRLRCRAQRIAARASRQLALDALGKRGNIEGAAAFASSVPRRRRRQVLEALIAFQAIYGHVDLLAEQPSPDPAEDARRWHAALLAALDASSGEDDWRSSDREESDGYLGELVDVCRAALVDLPSYPIVAAATQAAGARIVQFQSLSAGRAEELQRWAECDLQPGCDLQWWEGAAASGSSLLVNALIAAAAEPTLSETEVRRIERCYFPWAGALHSLLDSLVDTAEDAATAQLSLIAHYPHEELAATRLAHLAEQALRLARNLPGGRRHALLLTAMACSYISEPPASAPGARSIARAVRSTLGPLAVPTLLIFRVRRFAGRLIGPSRLRRVLTQKLEKRGARARAA